MRSAYVRIHMFPGSSPMILVPIVLSAINVLMQTLFSQVRKTPIPFNMIH
jgi:hypothetical protein